ncbi:hypothetical protein JCM3770_002361 [Rhodotorula araucariae]
MSVSIHAQLAAIAGELLSSEALQRLPLPSSPCRRRAARSPAVPTNVDEFRAELHALGCSQQAEALLTAIFGDGCRQLAAESARLFEAGVAELSSTFSRTEEGSLQVWEPSFSRAQERQYAETTLSIRQRILTEVRAAQARHAQAQAPLEEPQPGVFMPEVLAILNAAFQAHETVSRAERRELASVTGLTERQILTWFANQRQRRHKKRAAPYDLARRPPQHKQEARRTPSGSSSSSSLVEYAESGTASVSSGASATWSPTSGTYLAQGDIPVGDPSPTSAAFASYAAQFQLPHPPPLQQEEVEVPMMELTQPTPRAPLFPPLPAAAPYERPTEWWIPAPSSHDSAPSADSFIQALSSSPSSSTSSLEAYLPPAPFAVAPPPAPLVGAGGLSDAWMDDTFYENLFGSLGLDLAGAGAAQAPGLTLSMDAVRAEEAQAQAVGGGEMSF